MGIETWMNQRAPVTPVTPQVAEAMKSSGWGQRWGRMNLNRPDPIAVDAIFDQNIMKKEKKFSG